MKFTILLKDNNNEIDAAICRALLLLSFLVTFLYKNELNPTLNLLMGLVLLTAAIFTKYLLFQLRVKKIILLSMAAIILLIATGTFTFSLLLLLFGMLTNLLHKTPVITIDATEVRINKVLSNKGYRWAEFSNIILKDNLLTIDFEDNKILQLEVDETAKSIDEGAFNTFCHGCLQR